MMKALMASVQAAITMLMSGMAWFAIEHEYSWTIVAMFMFVAVVSLFTFAHLKQEHDAEQKAKKVAANEH